MTWGENEALHDVAFDAVRGLPIQEDRIDVGVWDRVSGGVFVTAYRDASKPMVSENVWCCMSDGDYAPGGKSVFERVVSSTSACRSRDSRRTAKPPQAVEVTVLQPKPWRQVSVSDLRRTRERAVCVTSADGKSAIYLPAVWNERPDWTAQHLVESLARKARTTTTNIAKIEEIGVYLVERGKDRGFFETPPTNRLGGVGGVDVGDVESKILARAWQFYKSNIREDRLAYRVTKKETEYADDMGKAQGSMVRTLSDAATFYRLARRFGSLNVAIPIVARLVRIIRSNLARIQGHDAVASLQFLVDVGDDAQAKLKLTLAKRIVRNRLVFSKDASFEGPQAMLALADFSVSIGAGRALHDLALQFLKVYGPLGRRAEEAVKSNGAFAANWILQAAAALKRIDSSWLLPDSTLQLLRSACAAVPSTESITMQVCARQGLVRYWPETDIRQFVSEELASWQAENGGFSYEIGSGEFRTDVTSHVVGLVLLAQRNSEGT